MRETPPTGLEVVAYLGVADGTRRPRERHLSLVPLVPGLEALCGCQLVETSAAGPWRRAWDAASCRPCRAALSRLAQPEPHRSPL